MEGYVLITAAVLAGLLCAATLVPYLPVAHGLVRIGGFPRQQILVLAAIVLVLTLAFGVGDPAWNAVRVALASVILVQGAHIAKFTPLWRKQTADFDAARDTGEALRLMACNVKMSNRQFDTLAGIIRTTEPDILVLMEVDQAWVDALEPLLATYAHVVRRPQDNTYGMVLASRHRLTDTQVRCLLTEDVPSVVTTVTMPEGRRFRLYAIHPEPPVPHRGSEGRDGETSLVSLKVREERLPVLVTGDLNDVAWSVTTRRFRRISRLLDPRIGRKVFSTFDARYPPIRWPLDHLFHSPEFRLKGMRRLPACGSDHFPVAFDVVLCSKAEAEARPDKPDGDDIERARDLADQAKEREGPPIGANWEG